MNKLLISLVAVGIIILGIGAFFLFLNNPAGKQSTQATEQTNSAKKIDGYQGDILAGSTSPFIVFNKVDYDKAIADGKIVFLDFYANWCPICRAEAPEIHAGFDELNTENIIGFRVNFNDSETDEDEKALAKELDVPYQHTKVILRDGNVALKDGDTWDKTKFLEEVNKL